MKMAQELETRTRTARIVFRNRSWNCTDRVFELGAEQIAGGRLSSRTGQDDESSCESVFYHTQQFLIKGSILYYLLILYTQFDLHEVFSGETVQNATKARLQRNCLTGSLKPLEWFQAQTVTKPHERTKATLRWS